MTRTLLVADDAVIIREKIKDLAMQSGWTIVGEAGNGQEAIDAYAKLRPDVVTLDLVMPEFDGLYALRGIMSLNPNAKVVIVSALEQKTVLKDAFKVGAADFLVKPFSQQILIDTLEQVAPAASASAG